MGECIISRLKEFGDDLALYQNYGVIILNSQTFTVPVNGTYSVRLIGGGGGGGYAAAGWDRGSGIAWSTVPKPYSGGSGYYNNALLSLTKGQAIWVEIGQGGAGGGTTGAPYPDGGTGGTTSFGSYLYAAGGTGGGGTYNAWQASGTGAGQGYHNGYGGGTIPQYCNDTTIPGGVGISADSGGVGIAMGNGGNAYYGANYKQGSPGLRGGVIINITQIR